MYNLSYSGMLYVESHADILDYCARAGVTVNKFNRCVRFESTVTDCRSMFAGMSSFNHSVIFPSQVHNVENAFVGCSNFKQYIFIDHDLFSSINRSPKAMGLADMYPTNRIIVTNSNNSFDLYLGNSALYPPSVPGIIQLMRNDTEEELLNCMMFFRSLPEFRFSVKNVYVAADNPVLFLKISEMIDAAIGVSPEIFADTKYHILADKDHRFEDNLRKFTHLESVFIDREY